MSRRLIEWSPPSAFQSTTYHGSVPKTLLSDIRFGVLRSKDSLPRDTISFEAWDALETSIPGERNLSMLDDDTTGMVGRVSVPIPRDGPGEIILSIRGGSEAFTAYTQGDETLNKNSRAVVVEQTGPRTVLVTAAGY